MTQKSVSFFKESPALLLEMKIPYEFVSPSVGMSLQNGGSRYVKVGRSDTVCHNFLSGREVSLPMFLSEHLFLYISSHDGNNTVCTIYSMRSL